MKKKDIPIEAFPIVLVIFKEDTYQLWSMMTFEEAAVNAILEAGATGEVGDGKIFVSTIDECYRIRTGEKGGDTLK